MAPRPGDQKRLATLQACSALVGYALQLSEDDSGRPMYVITRRALCLRFSDLNDVERWLQTVGAVEVTT